MATLDNDDRQAIAHALRTGAAKIASNATFADVYAAFKAAADELDPANVVTPPVDPPVTTPPASGQTFADTLVAPTGAFALTINEQFTSTTLDTSRWWAPYDAGAGSGTGGVGQRVGALTKIKASTDNTGNNLTLTGHRPRTDDYDPNHYQSAGAAMGKASQLYGVWETRVKIDKVGGFGPAIMLWMSDDNWPAGIEVDIMEVADRARLTGGTTLHKVGNAQISHSTGGDLSVWTTFTVVWLPDRLVFYRDGVEYYRVTDATYIPSTKHHFVAQIDMGSWIESPAANDPTDCVLYVDYVKQYSWTAPASTGGGTGAPTGGSNTGGTGTGGTGSGGTTNPTPGSTSGWYANGAPPAMDLAVARNYAKAIHDNYVSYCWRQSPMPPGTPQGAWRVIVPAEPGETDPGHTVSEGMGYGMLASVIMGNPNYSVYDSTAKGRFDGLWMFVSHYLDANGLMNWYVHPDATVGTGDYSGSATDGDVDICFALVLAHRTWGSTGGTYNYGALATTMINALRDNCFLPANHAQYPNRMLNGDQWNKTDDRSMPDYFAPAWFYEFYVHTGDTRWLDIIAANYGPSRGFFDSAYSTGMIPDECTRSGGPVAGKSYKYSYNAIRSPWRSIADWLWHGTGANALARTQADKLATFGKNFASNNPANLFAEWTLDGSSHASYLNPAFVQAFGVAGIGEAKHSQWAADCLLWLYNNRVTGQSYFSSGLSTMSALMIAGLFNPLTPSVIGTPSTGSGTVGNDPGETPQTTPTGSLAGKQFYLDTNYAASQWAQEYNNHARPADGALMTRLANVAGQGMWIGDWYGCTPDTVKQSVAPMLTNGKIGVQVIYNITGRDSGGYSAGGAATSDAYIQWVTNMANALSGTDQICILEPDALPQLLNLNQSDQQVRLGLLRKAAQILKGKGLRVYQDAGHNNWWDTATMAQRLIAANIDICDGFALNTSNNCPLLTKAGATNMTLLEYAKDLSARVGGKPCVIDTGRAGANNVGDWCNPPGRLLGPEPTTNTGYSYVDAFTWAKKIGESDGQCNGGPAAGVFWPEYALDIAKRTWTP